MKKVSTSKAFQIELKGENSTINIFKVVLHAKGSKNNAPHLQENRKISMGESYYIGYLIVVSKFIEITLLHECSCRFAA